MKKLQLTEIGEARLHKLINFLKDLSKDEFYFANVVQEYDKINDCGTVCCAIGWTPKVFPSLVQWCKSSYSVKVGDIKGYAPVSSILFGIPYRITSILFFPCCQKLIHDSLPNISGKSTPKDAASMINQFIKLCKMGEIKLTEDEVAPEPIPDTK